MIKPLAPREEILFLWQKYINQTVSIEVLRNNLSILCRQGYSIEYLLYCLKYVIRHNMNLQHPAGFKYFAQRDDIKRAYRLSKIDRKDVCGFKTANQDGVKFNFKPNLFGFHKILK